MARALSEHRWIAASMVRPALDAGAEEALVGSLDEQDRVRYERTATADGRAAFLVGRSLLRAVLAAAGPLARSEISFQIAQHGKPELTPELFARTPIHFNLAHSRTHFLVGVSRNGDIGVDVETIRPYGPRLPKRFFRPEEVAALEGLAPQARPDAFFHLWVIKEACVKAHGGTLAPGLGSIPASLEASGGYRDLRWEMLEVSPLVKAAIALRASDDLELRPGLHERIEPDDLLAGLEG